MANNPFFEWLNAKKLSQSIQYRYQRHYKRFEAYPFTQQGINDYFTVPKVNNSTSRAFLKNLLNFLGVEDDFKIPPAPTGKKKQRIIRGISMPQIKAIRHQAYKQNTNTGFMFDFLYYGALRRSEVCKIRINSFNWSEWFEDWQKLPDYPCDPIYPCELKIEMAKNNKDRIVLIPAHIMKHFVEFYMEKTKMHVDHLSDIVSRLNNVNEYVFLIKNGKRLNDQKVWKMIKSLTKKAIGIAIRPHELRHARATEFEKSGQNIRAIQHYLGHSTPAITETYLHTSEKHSLSQIKESMALSKDL